MSGARPPKVPMLKGLDQRTATSSDSPSATYLIAFDTGELINYFRGSRLPTGIQRVELNVIASLLRRGRCDATMAATCYSAALRSWVRLPDDLFLTVADLAVSGGRIEDPDWREALKALELSISAKNALSLPTDALLLNLGASWWQPDYFLSLRLAKQGTRIIYIPLIYDCIPILRPEFCEKRLHQAFLNWVIGVLNHADHYLAISESSAREIIEVAARLGRRITQPDVIRLDARFSRDDRATSSAKWRNDEDYAVLSELGDQPFVLFVSTIEPRKNQHLVFRVWLALIRKRGLANTPTLVCVGKPGWMHQHATDFLSRSDLLRRKVVMLSKLDDDDLSDLYRRCLFTVFPSSHEGWGLPVTESLCYGKVPLTAANTSLREAGGDFGDYFDDLSERDFQEKLERLIDDSAYREARQTKIAADFRSRSWDDIADEIVDRVLRAKAAQQPGRPDGEAATASPAEIGRFYPMSLITGAELAPSLGNGEVYRAGEGWWSLDTWGTWMKQELAEIAFSLPSARDSACLLYLGLVGPPEARTDYRVRILGGDAGEHGTLREAEPCWVVLRLGPETWRDSAVRVQIMSNARCDLCESGGARIVTLGVVGFFVCREDDVSAQHRFAEALLLDRLKSFNSDIGGA